MRHTIEPNSIQIVLERLRHTWVNQMEKNPACVLEGNSTQQFMSYNMFFDTLKVPLSTAKLMSPFAIGVVTVNGVRAPVVVFSWLGLYYYFNSNWTDAFRLIDEEEVYCANVLCTMKK
jgi:hypothetical protein